MKRSNDGSVKVTIHEPLSFYRRSGRVDAETVQDFETIHTEESVLKLKALGLTMYRIHFFKGMGYRFEQPEREQARELIKLCHKHGIKVQVYIQFGSMMGEIYREEEPDYDSWYARDDQGNPITVWYGHQLFRERPCLTQNGWWDHLKIVLKDAIVDSRADVIGFDNVSGELEPEVCHCDACKKAFVEFMQKRYPTPAEAEERFGHAFIQNIRPPRWNYYTNHYNLTEIIDPVLQEWMEFRAWSKKRRIDEMYQVIKSLNPDVVAEINAFKQSGQNSTFHFGHYVDDLADGCDAFVSESEPGVTGYLEDGTLTHKIRAYKKTHSLNKLLYTGHWGGGKKGSVKNYTLAICEGMAFNYGILNFVGLLQRPYRAHDSLDQPHMPLLAFYNANREIYDAEPVPSVHLYESRASLSYSNFEAHYANLQMQQVLLRERIPYAILSNLSDIGHCQSILLPGTMCLSEEEIAALDAFVRNGGGLVITGNAGDFDLRYRGLLGKSLRGKLGVRDLGAPCLTGVGKGLVAVLPRLSSKNDFDTYDWANRAFEEAHIWVHHRSWDAPGNARQVAEAIRWTARNDLPFTVDNAPEYVVCEYTEGGGARYLHLLNYKVDEPVKALAVSFKKPFKSAELFLPNTGEKRALSVLPGHSVIIGELDLYGIVKLTD